MSAIVLKNRGKKKSKNQIRRERAKLAKNQKIDLPSKKIPVKPLKKDTPDDRNVDIELTDDKHDELLNSFKDIFQKFEVKDENYTETDTALAVSDKPPEIRGVELSNLQTNLDNSDMKVQNDELSKRKFKKLYSIPLYVLKAESKRAELVEWMDANSPDPRLHVYLKTLQNSVKVPTHWCTKKSFLSTKRAIERPPFQLPDFILETGILEMRDTSAGTDDHSTLKQRMRERVQPKSGQLDLDYEKLYDAFFRYQKKPFLLKFGRLFNENMNIDDLKFKETFSQIEVGTLSRNLKFALGMVDDAGNVLNELPPWYQKFEQTGPPPSYPNMKIGLSGQITINSTQGSKKSTRLWGTLINDLDVEDHATSNTEDEEEKNEPESKFDKSRGDVLLSAFGDDPAKYQNLAQTATKATDREQTLYKVLESAQTSNDSSIFGAKTSAYKM